MLRRRYSALPGFGLSLGFTTFYLSLVVLIPLAGLFWKSAGLTWAQMADALGMNSPQACQQRLDRLLTRRARDDRGGTA